MGRGVCSAGPHCAAVYPMHPAVPAEEEEVEEAQGGAEGDDAEAAAMLLHHFASGRARR